MAGSIALDAVLALVLIVAIITGWRSGLIRAALSVSGMVAGGIAAYFLLPYLMSWVPDKVWRGPAAILAVLILVLIGGATGRRIGSVVRRGAAALSLGFVDRLLGALGKFVGTVLVVMLVFSSITTAAIPVVSPFVGGSQIYQALENFTPSPLRELLVQFRGTVLNQGVPWVTNVIGGITNPPNIPETKPSDQAVAAAEQSIIRVTGVAYACGSGSTGSGFVIAPGRVLTNAHVVAGVTEPLVAARDGVLRPGVVVAIDQILDLAVIAVDNLPTPALNRDPTPAVTNEVLAVAGYPGGGPLKVATVRLISSGTASLNISGTTVTRDVMSLAAKIVPGNSGGPVLSADGTVVGIVFAASTSVADLGFAVPVQDLNAIWITAASLKNPVDPGSCLR